MLEIANVVVFYVVIGFAIRFFGEEFDRGFFFVAIFFNIFTGGGVFFFIMKNKLA